jgi:hypothetical protein
MDMAQILLRRGGDRSDRLNRAPSSATPQQNIDSALNATNMINSPLGFIGRGLMPGGGLMAAGINSMSENTMAGALGVNPTFGGMLKGAIGQGPARNAFNKVGLVGRDFTTPSGGYAPAGGIVTRQEDRFGGPRGERGSIGHTDSSARDRAERGNRDRGTGSKGGMSGR